MDLGLQGRTALITGGSKGIGRAVAEVLAAEGCHLHLAAREEQALKAAQQAIRQRCNVAVTIHPIDLGARGSAAQLAERAGDCDILVNNAGAIPFGSLEAIDEERWRQAWDLKVFGYINLTRAYHARMVKRGKGVIVNVIGQGGERMDGNYIAGAAGNAGLFAFTRALGADSIDKGVRVVGVSPGPVATERLVTLTKARSQRELGDASRWEELMAGLPMGRAAKPEEIADLVAFVASDRAAYISGVVYAIDGGTTLRRGR
jgi:NAD(P)-dependent dehydrogenase (short-subunit alcohol dehydrogenase family)